MGKIKRNFILAFGCFGMVVLAGCNNGASGDSEEYDFELIEKQSSTSVSLNDSVSSSSESITSSESQIIFDTAYFGGVSSVVDSSSSQFPPLSSSSMMPPRSSSSEVPPPPPSSDSKPVLFNPYIVGADISRFQEYESYGTKIYDVDGTEKDIFALLRDHGFNAVRLKTFLSPKAAYGYAAAGCGQDSEAFGDKEHVVAYAQKVKKAGFTFLLDIHYSDVWADPDTQIIPERWRKVANSDAMADSVYNYTYDLMAALKQVDALPDMVQVGNEITNGMLREIPKSNTDCWGNNVQAADGAVSGVMSNATGIANTAKYLAAGSRAVKEISNNIKVVFHIESPHKTNTVDWWMSSIIKNSKVSPDVMAFSAYSAYEHGNPDSWKNLMTNLGKTYTNLEFLIAEYNGSSTPDNYGFDGSRVKTHQVMEQVPRALGAFIWEPERSGAWGTALFDWVGGDLKANKRAFDEYEVLF